MLMGTLSKISYYRAKVFGKYLWLTNTITCGAFFGLGDLIQQSIEFSLGVNKTEHYDWKRTRKLIIVGLTQGPPHHIFYSWLDKVSC